jgi:hypothetical protein
VKETLNLAFDRERNCCCDIFVFISIGTTYIMKLSIYLFFKVFCVSGQSFCIINSDASSPVNPDYREFTQSILSQ